MSGRYTKNCSRSSNASIPIWSGYLIFIAISDGSVAEERSPERFLEVIMRLEREVFGTSKIRGPRVASVRVGEPKNLRDCYDTYKAQKRETVEQITLELETTVRTLVTGVS